MHYITENTYLHLQVGWCKDNNGLNISITFLGGVLQSTFPSQDLRTEMPSLFRCLGRQLSAKNVVHITYAFRPPFRTEWCSRATTESWSVRTCTSGFSGLQHARRNRWHTKLAKGEVCFHCAQWGRWEANPLESMLANGIIGGMH